MMSPENLTKNQNLVFQVLRRQPTPLSAYDILDALREDGFRAPLQVYRALDKLMDRHLVHRLESLNAFVACRHDRDHDRQSSLIFMICTNCGQTDELADTEIAGQLAERAEDYGFLIAGTMVELRGICARCATAA